MLQRLSCPGRRGLWPLATAVALTLTLAACGGGGGSSSADSGGSSGATATPTSFAAVVPGASMTWETSRQGAFTVHVTNAAGAVAAGAAVRLFTVSMTNLSDGSALEEPIPVSLIDTAVTDGNGLASFTARLPDSLTEVLLVVTWDDQQVSRKVTLGSQGTTVSLSTVL